MSATVDDSAPAKNGNVLRSRWVGIALILTIGALLALVYSSLLVWLGRTALRTSQLHTGGLLVLFAIAICLRDALGRLRIQPNLNTDGLGLLALALSCLWMGAHWKSLALPLVLFSFCLSFAAVISMLFGTLGVRMFLPALGAFLVFGLLVGLFPSLDWPLREIAARQSASLLTWMDVPVKLALIPSRPPELWLAVNRRIFVVATECNGFGLLTSSLLLATILAFQYQFRWARKIGLFGFAILAAIVFNFLRIVSICLVVPRTQLPYEFVHEGLGTIFYVAGLALVWFAAGPHSSPKPPAAEPEKKQEPALTGAHHG
ncbi:MAG TPA: exosortase/archaeosortase family protein [Anaerolineales bacterium]